MELTNQICSAVGKYPITKIKVWYSKQRTSRLKTLKAVGKLDVVDNYLHTIAATIF